MLVEISETAVTFMFICFGLGYGALITAIYYRDKIRRIYNDGSYTDKDLEVE